MSPRHVIDPSKKKFLLQVKEAHVGNNNVGYYFYFRKKNNRRYESSLFNNLENLKIENPPSNRAKLNKSSIKFIEDEDEHELAKSSRIYNDEEVKKNILALNNINLNKNEIKKSEKNQSNVSFDLDNFNLGYQRKHDSAKMVSDFKDDNDQIIDEKYVPKCNFNFYIDLSNNTFKPTSTTEQTNQVYNDLRSEALEKINIVYQIKKNLNKKESTNSENSSKEDSSNNEYTSSYNDSSINSISKKEESKIKSRLTEQEKIKKEKKESNSKSNYESNIASVKKNKIENIENEYYKIMSLNKIKLMVYDFNKEMVINAKNEKKSQVEIIIDSYKSRQNINISEDTNYVNLSFDKYIKDLKNKGEKDSSKNLNKKVSDDHKKSEKSNVVDIEKEFEKEITYTISRHEDQNSIIYFFFISFVFIFLLLLIYILESFFIIAYYNAFKENLILIISSINLRYYTNIGIFSARETSLMSFDGSVDNCTYHIPDTDKDTYAEKINGISKNAFSLCNSYMETIIGSSQKFSEETLNILSKNPFNITIRYGDNQYRNVTSTVFASIIQVYSAFCNLIQNLYVSVASIVKSILLLFNILIIIQI